MLCALLSSNKRIQNSEPDEDHSRYFLPDHFIVTGHSVEQVKICVFSLLAAVKLKAFLPFVSQTAKDEHKNLLGGSAERLLFILFLQ